ncbi:hypothetical protein HN460_02215 [bacterium]|jgi:hypothetical protein|nr:hypothetical protein [bacterium]MBT3794951.1 hypothetical protein [bacterium]MBT4634687.1 hypothetical protein [bacterium]
MIKKSTKNISIDDILRKFNFIEEGSIIIFHDNYYLLASCMQTQSVMNFDTTMDFELVFNPIMQGDFPTLELKIEFYKNKVKVETISNLISVDNINEVQNICNYFSFSSLPLIVFSKRNNSLKILELKNQFSDKLAETLNHFRIDIKDIIKNTNN